MNPATSHAQRGFVTAQFMVLVAFSLLFFVFMVSAILFLYGRGVVRAALDEGVRQGSRATTTAEDCQAAAEEVLATLMGGTMGTEVTITCTVEAGGDRIVATADGALKLPFFPRVELDDAATAVKEQEPGA